MNRSPRPRSFVQHMTRAFKRGMWLSISLSWVLLILTTFGPAHVMVTR